MRLGKKCWVYRDQGKNQISLINRKEFLLKNNSFLTFKMITD